jgi:tight adherence protein B
VSALVAVTAGLAIGLGLWLAVLALAGRVVIGGAPVSGGPEADTGSGRTGSHDPLGRRARSLLGSTPLPVAVLAVAVGVAIALTTGLVVAAGAATAGVLLVPQVLAARARRAAALAKMRAAAEFVESIRGALGAGSGLESAILDAASRPPRGLAPELADFVEDARTPEVSLEQALRRLADRAGEPAIDLLVGSLLAALRGAAGDMGRLFDRIAEQGRAFADGRAATQAERARVEFQTKVLSVLVILVALLSVLVSPDLTAVYGPTVAGQLLLAIPVVVFGFGWWWLIRLNQVEGLDRFQLRAAAPSASGGREGRP